MTDVEDLGQGITRLGLPLPIERLPTVNAFVFAGPSGLTVIDPGGGHEEGYQGLRKGLAEAGYSLEAVSQVVATHLHPDHMGLATRLVEEVGCSYVMHTSAHDRIDGYNDWSPLRIRVARLAAHHGAPPEMVVTMGRDDSRPAWAPPSMEPTVLVDDGGEIPIGDGRSLIVVHTPGHDESHICLIDSRTGILFSGDHILPRITPFVPFPEEDPDNLGTYLASLDRVVDINPPLTWPAHLDAVELGAGRAKQIALHHQRRLHGMLDLLAGRPATAWWIMEQIFKPNLPPLHSRLAFQETLAHLEYLRRRNLVEMVEDDESAVYRRTRPPR